MSKLSIKCRLYLFSGLLPFVISLIANTMYWLNAGMASNINFTNTDNVILKALPYVTNYLHILLDIAFIAVSISLIAYSRLYFGPTTSIKTALLSLSAFLVSEILSYCYNVIYNTFNSADFKATLISTAVELLYLAVLMFVTPLLSKLYIKTSLKSADKLSRLKISTAVVPSLILYFIIQIAELTNYTITAVKSYISYGNVVSSPLIISIILDVLYYGVLHLAVPISLALLTSYVLTKATGPLKLKIKGESSKK